MTISRRAFVAGMLMSPVIVAGCAEAATGSTPAAAGTGGKRDSRDDWRAYGEYLKQQSVAGQFSGAVLVARGGQALLKTAYGMADRQRGIANTAETRFCVCSMGKMFTAVGVAQLVEHGRLAFHDTIGKYVSGFPPEVGNKVTIDELLTHTAGMGDALKRDGTGEPPTTLAGLMELITKTPLLFEPGAQMSYSNSGFIVLGAIIESVTRQSYRDYVHDHVFRPAGMADTDIRVYKPDEIPRMAHPYALVDQGGTPEMPPPGPNPSAQPGTLRDVGDMVQIGNPSGGAYSTVGDMFKFARALTGHQLLSPALTNTVITGKVDVTGPGRPPGDKYAYGFDDMKINGVRIVGHNGGSPGYEAQLDAYPDLGYTVVVLTNQDRVMQPAIRRSEDILTR
jgi:CubicO group peptidase (beta-lactamase class C family)